MTVCSVRDPALWTFDRLSVDLSDCELLEISVALLEHETAGLRSESWPQPVRVAIERELQGWAQRNPNRIARAITTSATKGACCLAIHHAPRKP